MQSRRFELDAYKQCGMKLTEGFKVYTEKKTYIFGPLRKHESVDMLRV